MSDSNDISDSKIDSSDVQKNLTVPHGRVFYLPAIRDFNITNITPVAKYAESWNKKSDSKSDSKRDSKADHPTHTYTYLPHGTRVLTFQRVIFGALTITTITLKS